MMVRAALWDRCLQPVDVLHPSHDAPRSLFARAKPAPGDEAGGKPKKRDIAAWLVYQRGLPSLFFSPKASIAMFTWKKGDPCKMS